MFDPAMKREHKPGVVDNASILHNILYALLTGIAVHKPPEAQYGQRGSCNGLACIAKQAYNNPRTL